MPHVTATLQGIDTGPAVQAVPLPTPRACLLPTPPGPYLALALRRLAPGVESQDLGDALVRWAGVGGGAKGVESQSAPWGHQ